MKGLVNRRLPCLLLLCALILPILASCGTSNDVEPTGSILPDEYASPTVADDAGVNSHGEEAEQQDSDVSALPTSATPQPPSPVMAMTQEQQNSINMLNYLTVLVQEIQESKNSRLYLESAYSELINNTEPSILDDLTLDEYEKILTVIENYRMTAVQRTRLQYVYEQNRAAAIRAALPSPLSVLNVIHSDGPLKTIASLVYMAVDSLSSYSSQIEYLDLQYLQDGWVLDDEEAANLHDSRTSMFSYMVRVSRDLPAGVTLSEEAVNNFVEWKNKENVTSRIRWLESNQDTYRYFGEYWLVLADSYYENEDYDKCLNAMAAYEALDNSIFRRDIRFAQTIPYAIVAAREILDDAAYTKIAEHYVQLIVKNTNNSDWALRYFAAQTYADLYALTDERAYLQDAYDLAYDNVNELVPQQFALNSTYLADVVETVADKGADKADKETIKSYNKLLKETRKTELPPVYEPVRLNCELLSALADQMDIGQAQREDIDKILHPSGERLFLNVPLDDQFYFAADPAFDEDDVLVEYDDGTISDSKIIIPAQYIPNGASVSMTITGEGEAQEYTDWVLDAVDRQKSNVPADFMAVFKSSDAKHASFADGDIISISVQPPTEQDDMQAISIRFRVHKESGFMGISSTEFERILS